MKLRRRPRNDRLTSRRTLLVQIAFRLILQSLGDTDEKENMAALQRVSQLVAEYPDTAGMLTTSFKSMQEQCTTLEQVGELWTEDAKKMWQKFGEYELGSGGYCGYGHPYSKKTFPSCPECGRRVQLATKDEAPASSWLSDPKAFMNHVRSR